MQAPPADTDAVKLAIISTISAFVTFFFTKLWEYITAAAKRKADREEAEAKRRQEIEDQERHRKWQREDLEWKAQMDARLAGSERKQDALLSQAETLNEKADANMVVSTVAAAEAKTGADAATKAAVHLTGEAPDKNANQLEDVKQRFAQILNVRLPGGQDGISKEPPGPAGGARTGPR